MANKMLRKITIKGCGFGVAEVKALVNADNPSANLVKIVGVTTNVKAGQTDKGEYLKLIGTFRAINMETGENFDSTQCILPNFISDSLAAALQLSDEVEFALMIGAHYDASAITEYVYDVTPLVEAKVSDKMAALLQISDAYVPPALEAPTPRQPAAKAKKAA